MGLADLTFLTDRPAMAVPKPLPHQLTKQAEQRAAVLKDDAFRALIWQLDGSRSRATGKLLMRSGTMAWEQLGEVDHSIPRSLAPDRLWDPQNALLLSKAENRLRKVPCPRAPEFRMFNYEGPDNRREPQTFIWRDADGKVVKRRIG
jgi:5-methylcytosine-specific restriction endonuclease McrA